MSDIHDAIQKHKTWSELALGFAHELQDGLEDSLLDIEIGVESVWSFSDKLLDHLAKETQILESVSVPAPLLFNGRFGELAPGDTSTRDSQADNLRELRAIAESRRKLIAELKEQQKIWRSVGGQFRSAVNHIKSKVEARMDDPGFLAKYIELETGAISMQAQDFAATLIPKLGERAALAESLDKELGKTIDKLELDLQKFERSLQIGEWLSDIEPGPQALRWTDPKEISADYLSRAIDLREKIIQGSIQAFEESERLVGKAEQIARHNARIASFQQLMSIVGGLAKLSSEMGTGNAGTPTVDGKVTYNLGPLEVSLPEGSFFELYIGRNFSGGVSWGINTVTIGERP